MYRADPFVGYLQPEEWAGKRFFFPRLLIVKEFLFIRVQGNDTFLTIRVPDPEFVRTDLLLYADDLPHGAAAVAAALAYKGHDGYPVSAG
jgi:phosphoenolpyruvate carboxylase